MKSWPTKPLSELLTTLESGSRPKGGVGELSVGIPSLGGEHINREGGFVWDTPKHVTRDFYLGMKRGRIQRGDILVVKDGATTGKTATVRDNFPFCDAVINEHVFLLRTDTSKVLSEYVGYFLFGPVGQQQILSNFRGAAIGGIAQDFVRNVQIPLAPLAEQERIVKLLDETDELRKLRGQADRRTAALIPALFHEMFGSPATNPFGWPIESVGKLFNQERGGARCGPFGSALKKHEYVETGIPVWGIPNVLPNQFVESGSLFISRKKFEELRAYSVRPGDLLLSRAGTVGRICVSTPTVRDSITGTNLIRLALDSRRVEPNFFSVLLTHFAGDVGRLRADINEGAYSFMNTTVLKTLRIPVPPLPLQNEFAQRVTEIRELEADQAASRRRHEALFRSLLYSAFQGKL
jgi:type I restriction enzyme, S subunit